MNVLDRLLGDASAAFLKKTKRTLEKINALEAELDPLSDGEVTERAIALRGRIMDAVATRKSDPLAMLEIDENGLDEMDKRILETIIVKFGGGPVGVNSLAVAVGEESDTLEEVYEPYLIMEGYLNRTSQGRVATELSYRKLGLKFSGGQNRLL